MVNPTDAQAQAWMPDLSRGTGPIYLAIADALEADIAAGILRPGQRLPTHRALAPRLGVDLTTVTRAYAEARRRGLVQASAGRGTTVRDAEPGARTGAAVEIDLSMNIPPQPPAAAIPESLARAAAAVVRRADLGRLMSYHPSGGGAEERAAGAAWLSDLLPGVAPDRVLVAGGGQAALMALLTTVARAGDTVLTEAFTYPGIRAAAAQIGLRLQGLAMDGEGVLPEALDAACAQATPKALYCVPTIQNPTTATMSVPRRKALADIALRRGLTIIEDDAYGLLPAAPLPPIATFAPSLTWYISSLSKCLVPGLRIAYVVAPDAREVGRGQAALRATLHMAAPISAAIATQWIGDGTALAMRNAIRAESRLRQEAARRILPRNLATAHPDGHHVWLGLPPGWSAAGFAEEVRRSGLAIVPGAAFAVGEASAQFLRLSLGAAPDRDGLAAALTRIRSTLMQPAPTLLDVV